MKNTKELLASFDAECDRLNLPEDQRTAGRLAVRCQAQFNRRTEMLAGRVEAADGDIELIGYYHGLFADWCAQITKK